MNRTEGEPNNKPATVARPPRPPRTNVDANGIPTDLKQLNQWLIWRHEYDTKRGKWTKVPYQASNPQATASSTSPSTWATFDAAKDAYANTTDVDGIGFAVTKSNQFTGVDLDKKIDPDTGEIDEYALGIINRLDSYTEITPSGIGYRVWVRGNITNPTGRKNTKLDIEMYDDGRYFTVTGQHVPDTPTGIATRQTELDALHTELFPPTPKRTDSDSARPAAPLNLSDDELIRQATRAKNGDRFDRLLQGDNSDYNNDASAADMAFVEHLHFHGATTEQIDRIYRNSRRARGKWDDPRGDSTYGRITIRKAQDGRVKQPSDANKQVNLTIDDNPTAEAEPQETTAELETTTYTHLNIDTSRYAINNTGIYPVKLKKEDGEWVEVTDYQTPIAGRPIWPNAIGTDVTDNNNTHVQLAWYDAKGNTRTKWVPHADLNDRTTIMNLDSAPVSYGRFARLTDWLADALGWIKTPPHPVFTRPYWDNNQFITPGSTDTHEYIGPDLPTRGTTKGWIEALQTILNLPTEASAPALTALGYSAISPAVNLVNKRRPIILFAHPSTSGKGAIINLALSIWTNHEHLTSPAGSTWKGTQDNALKLPDYPNFIDEAQQLLKRHPQIIEDLIYFYGNGKSRVLSSPNQTVRGGHTRNGVAFFAAEEDILEARQGGSQNRVISITTAPLPPNSPDIAAKLERAARNHYGTLGPTLVQLINRDANNIALTIEAAAVTIRNQHQTLRGDDAINLALLQLGLTLLSEATNIELPIRETVTWLARNIGQQRTHTIDRETKCLTEIINTIYAQQWLERDLHTNFAVDYLVIHGEHIAFRGEEAAGNSPLEVNPNSRLVKQILRDHDFVNPGPDWARRGWLQVTNDGSRVGFRKRHKGQIVGRFWRFTDEALSVAGVATPAEEVDA